MKRRLVCGLLGLLLVCALSPVNAGARPDNPKAVFGHVAAGLMEPTGDFGDVVDDDWILSAGMLYWPRDWAVGINLDLGYSKTDLRRSVINDINTELANLGAGAIAGGNVEMWSFNANGVWGPDNDGMFGFYVTAGVGVDYLEGKILDNGLVYYPPVCDPWFWWCVPGGVGQGSFVVLSEDSTDFSWNAGLGVTFDLQSGSQVFVEARYESVERDPRAAEFIPLIVGFRW